MRRTGQDEVEQRPELLEVVLQRRSGDEEPSSRVENSDDLTEKRVDVLDSVRLVDDDVLPRELFERRLLSEDHLV